QTRWPDDRFEALWKVPPAIQNSSGPPAWKIKCIDCPGKLYNPGPNESLSNFEVHLKNRNHRENVKRRLAKGES
ncbi:hypothetical protein PUNSTDRAFT_57428, partial [Punctularia strigosozonata HHB-11173 SS5]|uniref:uncharacterized protein n=1 Tax=Punctularia strigosozonata (strain HHB-11173) TaxID=741275 RepID=UPI0004418462